MGTRMPRTATSTRMVKLATSYVKESLGGTEMGTDLFVVTTPPPVLDALYLEDLKSREDAGTTPSILQRIKPGMVSTVQEEMGYRLIESREHSLITTALKRSENKKIVLESTQVKRAAIVSFLVRTTDSKDELQLQARYSLLKVSDDLSLKFRAANQEEYSGVKPGWTRLNFAYFLSKKEFHFLLCTIE
ncbi:hypothetical protein SELMODRAFT_427116 [Selaginella moellendorffii]|uniref:Uncharacterized protein n=1 Tax=Selaginella moellendorffii TaxID=88036 RepID=D8SYJ9_SELML|nr:hypothetical protein SELMODRAFT_427116 [Selaginella moellendorffii]